MFVMHCWWLLDISLTLCKTFTWPSFVLVPATEWTAGTGFNASVTRSIKATNGFSLAVTKWWMCLSVVGFFSTQISKTLWCRPWPAMSATHNPSGQWRGSSRNSECFYLLFFFQNKKQWSWLFQVSVKGFRSVAGSRAWNHQWTDSVRKLLTQMCTKASQWIYSLCLHVFNSWFTTTAAHYSESDGELSRHSAVLGFQRINGDIMMLPPQHPVQGPHQKNKVYQRKRGSQQNRHIFNNETFWPCLKQSVFSWMKTIRISTKTNESTCVTSTWNTPGQSDRWFSLISSHQKHSWCY